MQIVLATPAPVSHRTAEENLGIGYLAAVLRANGYRVRVVDGWMEGLTAAQLTERILGGPRPLFVGFSCYRSNMERALESAEAVRAGWDHPPVPLVAGGFGPTFHPDEFLAAGFDVVVRGEGEATVLELARRLATEDRRLAPVAGISFHRSDSDGNSSDENGDFVHNPARPQCHVA